MGVFDFCTWVEQYQNSNSKKTLYLNLNTEDKVELSTTKAKYKIKRIEEKYAECSIIVLSCSDKSSNDEIRKIVTKAIKNNVEVLLAIQSVLVQEKRLIKPIYSFWARTQNMLDICRQINDLLSLKSSKAHEVQLYNAYPNTNSLQHIIDMGDGENIDRFLTERFGKKRSYLIKTFNHIIKKLKLTKHNIFGLSRLDFNRKNCTWVQIYRPHRKACSRTGQKGTCLC